MCATLILIPENWSDIKACQQLEDSNVVAAGNGNGTGQCGHQEAAGCTSAAEHRRQQEQDGTWEFNPGGSQAPGGLCRRFQCHPHGYLVLDRFLPWEAAVGSKDSPPLPEAALRRVCCICVQMRSGCYGVEFVFPVTSCVKPGSDLKSQEIETVDTCQACCMATIGMDSVSPAAILLLRSLLPMPYHCGHDV